MLSSNNSCHEAREPQPRATPPVTSVMVLKISQVAVLRDPTDRMGATNTASAALKEADGLVVLVPKLTSVNRLAWREKEVWNTCERLLQQEEERERVAVAPNDEQDVEEHASILLLEGASDRVAERLMRTRREEVSSVPTFARQNEVHVHDRVDARSQRSAVVDAQGDFSMDALILSTASSSELSSAD